MCAVGGWGVCGGCLKCLLDSVDLDFNSQCRHSSVIKACLALQVIFTIMSFKQDQSSVYLVNLWT